MSVYLKVLPAVMLEPDILLNLGKKITSIVRESLILDRRMEEICTAIDREGRTLTEVIHRNNSVTFTGELDDAAIACEKSCSLLRAAVQVYFLHQNPENISAVQCLHQILEKKESSGKKSSNALSSDRFKDIIVELESYDAQSALEMLHLVSFYDALKIAYERYEATIFERRFAPQTELLPTLRSSIALYGMLIDTLIANVRFENYRLLHRVQSVLSQIEIVINEAVSVSARQQKKLPHLDMIPQQAIA
jgi:hypothetical protein